YPQFPCRIAQERHTDFSGASCVLYPSRSFRAFAKMVSNGCSKGSPGDRTSPRGLVPASSFRAFGRSSFVGGRAALGLFYFLHGSVLAWCPAVRKSDQRRVQT